MQAWAHPMWVYIGEDDPTREIWGDFYENKSIQEMLSIMFKGKMTDFPNAWTTAGFSSTVLVAEVSIYLSSSGLCPLW
jgi:hypothetical protein